MNSWVLIITISAGLLLIVVLALVITLRFRRRRDQPKRFSEKWLEIQRLCASKETWKLAVINADKLLDSALKYKRNKGKTMGERLVSSQRQFSDNDGVWFAHNLAKKITADLKLNLREAEAKKALVGVRQALRDLGILNGK